MDAFTTRPEVAHLETSLIFEYVRSPGLPLYGPLGALPRTAPSTEPVKRSRKRSRAAAR
jgi:hypothetical protein